MSGLSALVTDPAFALAFRVREPVPADPSTLLLLLHGVGGDETDLAGLAAGVAHDTLVVLPRGRLELDAGQHAWLERLGVPHNTLRLYPCGYGIDPAMARDFLDWLRALLPPAQVKNLLHPPLQHENNR